MTDKNFKALIFWVVVLNFYTSAVAGFSKILSLLVTPPNTIAGILVVAYAIIAAPFVYTLIKWTMYEKD